MGGGGKKKKRSILTSTLISRVPVEYKHLAVIYLHQPLKSHCTTSKTKEPKLPHSTATTRDAWCLSAPVDQEQAGLLPAFWKPWGKLGGRSSCCGLLESSSIQVSKCVVVSLQTPSLCQDINSIVVSLLIWMLCTNLFWIPMHSWPKDAINKVAYFTACCSLYDNIACKHFL